MKKFKTISDYVESEHPAHFRSGKWGCQSLTPKNLMPGDTEEGVKQSRPHGHVQTVGDNHRYWVWFDHD